MCRQHDSITGTITHIFAHRFVIETSHGALLADLTPHGSQEISLQIGDRVTVEGEMKPSELKVSRLVCGGKTVRIEHKNHDHHHRPANPEIARKAARTAGFEIIGEPRRKPKHFEVLGRRHGEFSELHIELDGRIRKTKAVHDPEKWADAMKPT